MPDNPFAWLPMTIVRSMVRVYHARRPSFIADLNECRDDMFIVHFRGTADGKDRLQRMRENGGGVRAAVAG